MATIDFSASPTVNQIYTNAGRSWIWTGTVWNAYSVGVPTISASDSPPASALPNEMWYESDSGKTFIFYDGYWVEISAPPSGLSALYPRGYVAMVQITTDFTVPAPGAYYDIPGASVTWNADPTRYYKVSVHLMVTKNTNVGYMYVTCATGAGVSVSTVAIQMGVGDIDAFPIHYIEGVISGSQTRKLQIYAFTAGAAVNGTPPYFGMLLVEDIGGR